MRRRIERAIVLGWAMLIPGFLLAQSAEDAIRKVLLEQVAAWNNGDVEGYMSGYRKSDETLFVSGGTVVRGYNQVLSRYKKNYDSGEKMGRLRFVELEIRTLSSTMALTTGKWELKRPPDNPWGRFTLLLEMKPDGWKIVYDHTSLGSE